MKNEFGGQRNACTNGVEASRNSSGSRMRNERGVMTLVAESAFCQYAWPGSDTKKGCQKVRPLTRD